MRKRGDEVRDLRVLPVDQAREAYEMAAECLNCGWRGRVLIPKGDRAPRKAFGVGERPAYCDSCGCREVVVR